MELLLIVIALLALDMAALKWGVDSSVPARIDGEPRTAWPFAPRTGPRG